MRETERPRVVIYTDGGCDGNPGVGGWAAVLRSGDHYRELSGSCLATTNNRMELRAAIEALRALKRASDVEYHTDSTYLRNGITAWLPQWKARAWRTAGNKPVQNADLWRDLEAAAAPHQIEWRWVKGHSGVPDNTRSDDLVRAEIRRVLSTVPEDARREAMDRFRDRAQALL